VKKKKGRKRCLLRNRETAGKGGKAELEKDQRKPAGREERETGLENKEPHIDKEERIVSKRVCVGGHQFFRLLGLRKKINRTARASERGGK